ncbi:MAG TPA: MupA/Atu3671 family FMN-dependent luciferase-like monooxygenase, partial [Herpetosiphonaceae bacterium]
PAPASASLAPAAPAASAPIPGVKVEPAPFVPYRPAEVAQNKDLSPRQQAYLQEFTERYNRRTQRSKQLTQHYRPVFSDSRNTAVFRLVWKELIYPIIGHRSAGSKIWDVDGNEYVDVTMGFGVHLFGHSPRFIMDAMAEQMNIGVHLGPQSYLAGEVSKLIRELTGAERVNLCNSGTEAVIAAIRIARTVRRKTKIVYFAGAYHGWSDVTMGRPLTIGGNQSTAPMAPGIPPLALEDAIILTYDDPASLEIIRAHAHELAAVLVEPVQSRRPDLQPREFLHALRALTAETGVPLIFDEMVNGFRIAPGGAQAFFGIQADIVTYGKIVGGGLPIGVIAGKPEYMDAFDGGMWQYGDGSYPEAEKTLFAGAFFKHPLTMAAALATLNHIKMQGQALYDKLNQRTTDLATRLNAYFHAEGVPIHVVHFSSVFRFYIPRDERYLDLFFYHLTEKGIYNWEGGNCFLSTAHTDEDMDRIVQAVQDSVADLRRGGFLPEGPGGGSGNGQASASGNGHPAAAKEPSVRGGGQTLPTAPASNWQENLERPSRVSRQVALHGPTGMQFSLYHFGSYAPEYSPEKYELLVQAARYADAHGFSAIWIPERHFHAFGSISPNPVVAAAALARETSRIHIRAGSVALPLHHPLRVAEEWSIVDNLSHGRVGISFASGWHPDDFVFAPGAFDDRRQIMLDGMDVVHHLWRGGSLQARGGAQSHRALTLFPLPKQPDLPSWLTCAHRDTFVRAGELGLGVLTNLLDQSIEDLADKISAYRAALASHSHDPVAGHVTLLIHTYLDDDVETAIETAREPFYGYLRSSLGLVRNMAKGRGREVDLERLSDEDLRYILADTYNRIVRAGTLIGTIDSSRSLVERLWACGVDEIGCLIDFGVERDQVLASLPRLDELRRMFEDLQRAARPAFAAAPAAPRMLPLTEAQKGLWVLAQLGDREAQLYNEALAMRLTGPLDIEAMRRSLHTIVGRHDSLRTTFTAEGDYQLVAPALTLDVPLIDLADLGAGEREQAVAAHIAAENAEVFDLVRGPLLRVKLLRLGAEAHVLLMTMHHIITDGWSADIVMRELDALYRGAVAGQPPELPTPLQFSDYLEWVQRQTEAGAEQFWLGQFAGDIPVLELPTDFPRPAIRRFSGAQVTGTVGAEVVRDLAQLASRHGATLFMTLLAGFNLLIHRLSGQNDVVIGAPAAGQLAMGGKYLTGYCLNLLALRSAIDPTQSFSAYLSQVRRTLLNAYEYQGYPFGTLVKQLRLDQDLSRSPLVSVVFNMEKGGGSSDGGATLGGLTAELLSGFGGLARFDININMIESAGGLTLLCDYNTDLFAADTISRWLGYFEQLLRQIAARPEQSLFTYDLLPDAEYQELMVARNATAATYDRDACFHHRFEAQADRTPDAVAAINGDQQLTYRELDQRANQLAHYLRLQGVGRGDKVGVCFERSLEMLVGLLGIFKAGGAFVPLDPTFPADRMAYILDDAGVQLVLTQAPLRERIPERERAPIALDADWPMIAHAPLERPSVPVTAQHLCYLIYTSGSTGRPKGVLIPHQGLMNYLLWCVDAYGAAKGRGAPVHASIAADAIFPSLFAPLLAGTTVVFFPGEAALDRLAAAVQREGPWSLIKITPSQLEVMTQSLPETDASGWVHTLVIGAEEVRGDVLRYWQRNAPATVLLNEYGPTETVVGCSIYQVPVGKVIEGTVPIGLPIANLTFYVLDRAMQPVPVGVPGELYIGGDGVAWGYHNRQALSAEKFVPDPFSGQPGTRLYRTGDLVRWISDRAGNVEFLGRIDDQVKIRGYRVEPGEVAGMLTTHPGIREAVVLARSDTPGVKRLVAYLVAQGEEPGLAELRQFLHARLPEYMVPSAFVFLPAIPLAPHGKINRSALPAPEQARVAPETGFVAPATPAELQMAGLWSAVLGVEQIGIHDNFFEIGGDSLLAVRLNARVRDAFQVNLAPRAIFERPTIDSLLLAVTEELGADDEALLAQLLDELEDLPDELPIDANQEQQ